MIRKGLLLPDSHPVGVGVRQSRRGIADLGDAEVPVIFKRIPEPELAAELFCAVLARELALPAPEPILLFDPESGEYLYGAMDMEYPNSLRGFNIDPDNPDMAALALLQKAILAWSRVREVAAFDEWIHNRDRNFGNLLHAGHEDFVIIDHGKALEIDPAYADQNILCQVLAGQCNDARSLRALLRALQRVAASFDIMHAEGPRTKLESTGIVSHTTSAETFYNLVEERLAILPILLQNRFPGQQGLTIVPSTS